MRARVYTTFKIYTYYTGRLSFYSLSGNVRYSEIVCNLKSEYTPYHEKSEKSPGQNARELTYLSPIWHTVNIAVSQHQQLPSVYLHTRNGLLLSRKSEYTNQWKKYISLFVYHITFLKFSNVFNGVNVSNFIFHVFLKLSYCKNERKYIIISKMYVIVFIKTLLKYQRN